MSYLNFAFSTVLENQEGFKLNGTHNLLVYIYEANIFGGSINKEEKQPREDSKNVGLKLIELTALYFFYISPSEYRTKLKYTDSN